MQDDGIPAFIAVMASTVLIIGVVIAGIILGAVLIISAG
jgi:hypothetical protein